MTFTRNLDHTQVLDSKSNDVQGREFYSTGEMGDRDRLVQCLLGKIAQTSSLAFSARNSTKPSPGRTLIEASTQHTNVDPFIHTTLVHAHRLRNKDMLMGIFLESGIKIIGGYSESMGLLSEPLLCTNWALPCAGSMPVYVGKSGAGQAGLMGHCSTRIL